MRQRSAVAGRQLAARLVGGLALGAALALLAAGNRRRAERALAGSSFGHYVKVAGVRLHYLESGTGMPLVLLHGNGSSAEDFASSGILEAAARKYRVLAFDRPGFGRSSRPRGTLWTPAAQADLLNAALARLGVDRYMVLGHSWGASVALQAAIRHRGVAAAVLVSGYYYPSPRLDAVMAALPAAPVLGTALRNTLLPPLTRLAWPIAMRMIFRPAAVNHGFAAAMKELATRPSQLRATAAESGLLIPAAAFAPSYAKLAVPLGILAGEGDRLLDAKAQAERLAAEAAEAVVGIIPGCGHMVHHTAPEAVLAMVDRMAARASKLPD